MAASSPTWDAAEFGRLLTHEEALRLAPTGFHLPTADEWQELNAQILSLAVYLGHRNIRHTYWYLSAVPELLVWASARWTQALSPQKGSAHV